MAFNAQTFPTDLLLPGLVSWFNSQSAELRVIETNDVALFRVRLVEDANGVVSMVVGEAPYTAEDSKYLYEATFIWRGARGINLTATTASFFEISKFVATPETVAEPLNVIPFVGHVLIPAEVEPEIPFLKMTFGTNFRYDSSGNNMYTVAIDGQGRPEIQSDNSYLELNAGLTGVVEVTGGDTWTAARTATGEVWAWGQNFSLFEGVYNEAQPIDIGYYTGSTQAKAIAALQDCLLVVDTDGNMFTLGNDEYLPNVSWSSEVEEVHAFWNVDNRVPDGGEYEEPFNQSAVFVKHVGGSWSVMACETHNGNSNFDVTIGNPEISIEGAVKKITGNFNTGAIVTTDGALYFWGDNDPTYKTGYVSSIFEDVDDVFISTESQVIVKKLDGTMFYYDGEQWENQENTPWTIKQVAVADYFNAILTTDNDIYYLGDNSWDRGETPEDLDFAQIRQIHMGGRWTCALMNDGNIVWWGGGVPM